MALNPTRDALGRAGLRAFQQESPFKAEADNALARFQAVRDDLERQVKRGDLTRKVAREHAAEAAARLKETLKGKAEGFSTVPRVFLDRLVEADVARKRARDNQSIEGLQRETNRLLRMSLVEQQLQTRSPEFEARTFVRSMTGGQAAPTLETLLKFHESATQAGDDAAVEWGRRQLEAIRPRAVEPGEQRKIDLACDRPEAVNPRLVETYVEAMRGADLPGMEAFVAEALGVRDANACVAAFTLAREAPGGSSVRWVRDVLNNLAAFPDAAIAALRAAEARSRADDAEAALAQAEYAAAAAESQARLDGVEPPTDAELARQARIAAKPVARLGEPIGLALERRGAEPSSPAPWLADEPADA